MCNEGKQEPVWGLPGFACGTPLNLEDLLGLPFVETGRDPSIGLDCTGLVIEIYKRLGVEITDPQKDPEGIEDEWVEVSLSNKRVFDLIGFETRVKGYVDHYAIYLGMGLLIHASQSKGVEVLPLRNVGYTVLSVLRLKRYVEQC